MLRRRHASTASAWATFAGTSVKSVCGLTKHVNHPSNLVFSDYYLAGYSDSCIVGHSAVLCLASRAHSTSRVFLNPVSLLSLPASPHQCSIEQVLLPSVQSCGGGGGGIRTETLRGMVQLLLDPDAANVEDVSMLDFVAMVPRRQLAALHGQKEWLDIILSSERYQACKDARALRLSGITTVGRWDENRDRVSISAYSRGILEETYAAMTRQPLESQKDQVITWLTKTIQKAVIDEFAANKSNRQILAPLITGMQALPETAMAASCVVNSVAIEEKEGLLDYSQSEERKEDGKNVKKKNCEEVAAESENNTASNTKASKLIKNRGKKNLKHVEMADEPPKNTEENTIGTNNNSANVDNDEEDEEIARLLKETEQEFAPTPYVRGSSNPKGTQGAAAAAAQSATVKTAAVAEESKLARSKKKKIATLDAAGGRTSELEAQQEERNVLEKTSSVTPAANPASQDTKQNNSLTRLAELMLIQFNSADGYLHISDIKDDEKKGFVIVMDDETAQVDPFALYSTFGSVKLFGTESPAITALKTVWSAYSAYTEAHDAADDDVMVKFFKEKGVEALVHGAVLLRAISREHSVTLNPQEIPVYGFPLLSSDRRSHRTRRNKGVTDMTAEKVADAVKAYTAFFANKSKRFTPIRPAIDYNSGCSVAALMGTTLHLYETSLKVTVREEDIRSRFAEALLGVLHILEKRVVTRVNVVHYHILVTSVSGCGVDGNPTAISGIDTSGPFSQAEKTRLQQLAEPLGMTKSIANFTCVSDFVDAIEALGVSVAHDVLTNREDLEALLTPTLVQLLPEAEDEEDIDDGVEEDVDSKGPERRPHSRRPAPMPKEMSTKTAGSSSNGNAVSGKAVLSALEEEDEEGEEEEEVVEQKTVRVTKQKSAATKYKASEDEDEDYSEEEEEEEEEKEEEEEVQSSNRDTEKEYDDDDDDVSEDTEEEEEEEEEDTEEEAEEEMKKTHLSTVATTSTTTTANISNSNNAGSRRQSQQPPQAMKNRPVRGSAYHQVDEVDEEPPQQHHQQQRTHSFNKKVAAPAPPRRSSTTQSPHAAPATYDNYNDNDDDEEAVRRPLKKSIGPRRTPLQAPPPPPPAANNKVVENDNSGTAEDEEEVVVMARPRSRGRRMARATSTQTSHSNDDDRWFQKGRR